MSNNTDGKVTSRLPQKAPSCIKYSHEFSAFVCCSINIPLRFLKTIKLYFVNAFSCLFSKLKLFGLEICHSAE
jgi:hypothetical protein